MYACSSEFPGRCTYKDVLHSTYKSVLTKLRRNQVGTFYNLFYRDIVQANRFAFFFQEKVEAQASRLLGNTPLD
jgi:hypothetical protein